MTWRADDWVGGSSVGLAFLGGVFFSTVISGWGFVFSLLEEPKFVAFGSSYGTGLGFTSS